MGLYDYVGSAGDQVKCFYVPCITVNCDRDPVVCFHTSGGRLKSYRVVPYQTPYYNYGRDFFVVEYRWEDNPFIHLFENARYVDTIPIDELDDTYQLPPVAVDHYGTKLNIKNVSELKAFVEDHNDKWELCKLMEIQYLSEYGLSYKLDLAQMKKLSSEEIQAESRIRDEVSRKVDAKTMKLFRERWFPFEDVDMMNLGLAIADYEELIIKKNPDRYQRHEYEWYLIFNKAIQNLNKRFDNPIDAYLKWCKEEGIKLKRWTKEVLNQYSQPAPEGLLEDYNSKKGDD